MQRNRIDVTQAADLLHLPPAKVREMVVQKAIPFVMVGPFVRFDPDLLEQWRDRNIKVKLGADGLTIDLRGTPIYTRSV